MVRVSPILLVEDIAEAVLLIKRAFTKSKILNPLVIVPTAEEAIRFLGGRDASGAEAEHPRPSLVLVGLESMDRERLELLRWIRTEAGANAPRVVILIGSSRLAQPNVADDLGGQACLKIPDDFDFFTEFSMALGGYWLWVNEPSEETADRSPTEQNRSTQVVPSVPSAPPVAETTPPAIPIEITKIPPPPEVIPPPPEVPPP